MHCTRCLNVCLRRTFRHSFHEKCFLRRTCRRRKRIKIIFSLRRKNSARLCLQSETGQEKIPGLFTFTKNECSLKSGVHRAAAVFASPLCVGCGCGAAPGAGDGSPGGSGLLGGLADFSPDLGQGRHDLLTQLFTFAVFHRNAAHSLHRFPFSSLRLPSRPILFLQISQYFLSNRPIFFHRSIVLFMGKQDQNFPLWPENPSLSTVVPPPPLPELLSTMVRVWLAWVK